jgi:type VI secretion system protein ImpG
VALDPRLLRAYNDELAYLREAAREFGEEHEAVASRLGLKTPTDPDPYVERLLEGVAFLGARVQLKLQDQFPDFTQHLLSAIQPHYLAPTPSICVAGFQPKEGDPVLVEGFSVPRDTELITMAADHGNAPVTFKSGHEVKLYPLKITEAEYLSSRAAVGGFASNTSERPEAGLRLRFEATGAVPLGKINPADLPLYLDGSEAVPGELYRQLIGETIAVVARDPESAGDKSSWTRLPLPSQTGFADDQALLPVEQRSFRGYRLLSEFFACPERFLFANLLELGRAFAKAKTRCDVVFLFSRASATLQGAVGPANFKLFATPAINLFEKKLGRVQVDPHQHEYHVVPDRTRPLDFEVFRIIDVKAQAKDSIETRPVAPLYALGALLYDWRDALFYVPRLTTRRLSTKEQRLRRRTDYIGTETWISLTAPGNADRIDDIKELAITAYVTNREMPELLTFRGAEHFTVPGGPIRSVGILRSPSKPRPPLGLNDAAWRVIAHLTPNYATLAPEDHDDPSLLRDHLALYGRQDDAGMRKQIDGILSIRSKPVTRRVSGMDRMAVARGSRITIRLDDGSYDNGRIFLFSAVLERFLAEFATVNSFTECVFETPLEGTLARWPARIGRKHNI